MTYDPSVIALAKIDGQSLDQIAKTAGVSRSTVQRALKTPEVREVISESRTQLRVDCMDRLGSGRLKAIDRIAGLIDSKNDIVALRAALGLLARTDRYDDDDLKDRLAKLERLLADTGDDEEPPS